MCFSRKLFMVLYKLEDSPQWILMFITYHIHVHVALKAKKFVFFAKTDEPQK